MGVDWLCWSEAALLKEHFLAIVLQFSKLLGFGVHLSRKSSKDPHTFVDPIGRKGLEHNILIFEDLNGERRDDIPDEISTLDNLIDILFVYFLLAAEVGVHFLDFLDEQLLHLTLVCLFDVLYLALDKLLKLSGFMGTRASKDFMFQRQFTNFCVKAKV